VGGSPKFGRVLMDYDRLTEDPFNVILDALALFTGDPVDGKRLRDAIDTVSGHKIAGQLGQCLDRENGREEHTYARGAPFLQCRGIRNDQRCGKLSRRQHDDAEGGTFGRVSRAGSFRIEAIS